MTNTTLFIVTGLVMTFVVGLFMGAMFTSGMKDDWKRAVVTIILALGIGFAIGGLLTLEHVGDQQAWNNGHCACGGEWELIDVEKSRSSSSTIYYYTCEECDHLIQTHTNFK